MNTLILKEKEKYKETILSEKSIYDVLKRVGDIFCSALALVILSPLFLITMLVIVIDDFGTPFYKQTRIGKDDKSFTIYKFRSMRLDADEHRTELLEQNNSNGITFKMEHDPRITRVGKFIRKSSIDELPQLINILKGDMSVVGPRPFIPNEQALLPNDRLLVKPGLSCYWQIFGKNNLSVEEQIELDLKYVKERSFFVDLKIILKTFVVIFKKENI